MAQHISPDGSIKELDHSELVGGLQTVIGIPVKAEPLYKGRIMYFNANGRDLNLPPNVVATTMLHVAGGSPAELTHGTAVLCDKGEYLMEEQVIYGIAKTSEVWIGEKKLDIGRSLQVENKSQSFSWGYHGSGPAQLSLAILLELCDNDLQAIKLFQLFKQEIIADFPMDSDLVLPVSIVKKWLADQKNTAEEETRG
jgi:hypothetical protein